MYLGFPTCQINLWNFEPECPHVCILRCWTQNSTGNIGLHLYIGIIECTTRMNCFWQFLNTKNWNVASKEVPANLLHIFGWCVEHEKSLLEKLLGKSIINQLCTKGKYIHTFYGLLMVTQVIFFINLKSVKAFCSMNGIIHQQVTGYLFNQSELMTLVLNVFWNRTFVSVKIIRLCWAFYNLRWGQHC